MRFAVLGANGQLGRDLCPLLPGEVLPLDRAQADLTKPVELAAGLRELRPEVVVNCAAYNFVDRAESEPEAAFAVNTWGVRALARVCREIDALVVHFSTDHVFGLDGTRRQPLLEDDLPGPVSVYGLSKLSGEYQVRALWDRHLIIRTCGLYGLWGSGGKGGNFVETMLRLASPPRPASLPREGGEPIRVVSDQFCTPTFTQDLARAVVALLEAKAQGLFHLTSAGSCSWFEFAGAIFELAGLKPELVPISSREYNAPARRPVWSVLASSRLAQLGLVPPRPWREALAEYLALRKRSRA